MIINLHAKQKNTVRLTHLTFLVVKKWFFPPPDHVLSRLGHKVSQDHHWNHLKRFKKQETHSLSFVHLRLLLGALHELQRLDSSCVWGYMSELVFEHLSFQCQICHHLSLISLSLIVIHRDAMSHGKCSLMSNSTQSEWMLII